MRRQAGFTLVEILVAVTITSLLLTTIYGVFTAVSEARQQVETRASATHLGRVVFARIGRELLGLSLASQGDQTVIRGGRDDRDRPYLELLSNDGEGRLAGLMRIRYLLVSGAVDDEQNGLWRLSAAAWQSPDELSGSRLSGTVDNFQVRFYDGADWRDSWDSNRDGVPKLVEVNLRLRLGAEGLPLHTIFRPTRGGTP